MGLGFHGSHRRTVCGGHRRGRCFDGTADGRKGLRYGFLLRVIRPSLRPCGDGTCLAPPVIFFFPLGSSRFSNNPLVRIYPSPPTILLSFPSSLSGSPSSEVRVTARSIVMRREQ